jgi:(p)ppGpp synthase/HD superfamily hydrolase
MSSCLDNPLIKDAYIFAEIAHTGQIRKYTGEPYVVHPRSVAETIFRLTRDVEMSVAAMLHDVVEDCIGYTFTMVEKKFGLRVRGMVDDLTKRDYPPEWTRKMRKDAERERLRNVCADSQTIKVADLFDNTLSIVPYDPKFARTYLAEKHELLLAMKNAHPLLSKLALDQLYAGFVQLEKLHDDRKG